MTIRKRPLENGSFREVIVIDGLIRIITIIRLFVNGNSDFKNLYRKGGKRFVDIKERMANVGMTQVDMILEVQVNDLARPLVGIITKFYADPKNEEDFQKWLRNVEERKQKESTDTSSL